MKNNCTCAICGKGYYVCLPCSKPEMNTWKLHTCTIEHYKVYSVIHGYSSGIYTKKETYDRLKNVDLSEKDSFKENVKGIIENIISECSEQVEEVKPVRSRNKRK